MIIVEMGDVVCKFVGTSEETPEKRRYVKAETLAGIRKETYADIYYNVAVTVEMMSFDNYKNLKKIFAGLDFIFLTDEDGIKRKVLFKDNTLALKKDYIKEKDENVYSGTLKFDEN